MLSKLLTLLRLPLVYKNWYLRLLGEIGFDRSRFIYSLWNGVKLKGTSEAPIIYDIWRQEVYNPKGFEIKNGDVIVDIGAHKGIFSIFAALEVNDVKVLSYEPVPNNFKLLQENIKLNHLTDKIKAFNFAVSAESGKRVIFLRDGIKDSVSHSFHYRTMRDSSIEVQCVTIEDIFNQNGISKCDLLKLDCEGAEYQILTVTPKGIFDKIEKISLEYHPVRDFGVEDLREFLEKLGFEVKIKKPYLYAKKLM